MLENALDFGVLEKDFWEMTLAELDRLLESKQRVEKARLKEKATYDYILAALVGRAVVAGMDSKVGYPKLEEVYPSLFDNDIDKQEREAKEQELKNNLSALRFKQFANFHNAKFKEVASDK
jgi:hypothetical protein